MEPLHDKRFTLLQATPCEKGRILPSNRPADKVKQNLCCYGCYDYDKPGDRENAFRGRPNYKLFDDWTQIVWKETEAVRVLGCCGHRPRPGLTRDGLQIVSDQALQSGCSSAGILALQSGRLRTVGRGYSRTAPDSWDTM